MRYGAAAAIFVAAAVLVLLLPVLWGPAPSVEPAPTASPAAETPAAEPQECRAVWISYLEWQQTDFSSAEAFRADAAAMLDNIAALGANRVFAHLRPFGDALYPSDYFPFSHLCTGTQGEDPGFDPLAILLEEAHARGLELEGWINPYRLQAGGTPDRFAATSPAVTHPDWVRQTGDGSYLNPASAQVRQYLADSLAELCSRYAVDGIHFDDYFYPTTDPAFDAGDYAASGSTLSLEDWRRENVNALMRLCCETCHRYGVRFGVAPQGTPEGCRDGQYSDAARWLAEGGYCDYLMPQLYWGRSYSRGGDTSQSLDELAAVWLALPRAEGVSLCFGLGAYRIGEGDGGDRSGPGTEWSSGSALAEQAEFLRGAGADGVGLYRYASLFDNTLYPTLAAQEAAALQKTWK
ncbi:MAG: family 10 glycosylhydrolase [Gemmiger sp.]|uniref:glycoside hydrolase family 10 protein n=1 Tax=Gemmiger sp. TaxID=2049027 RepID=UPI002E76443B|nr:family 10 glycosylhydrolase [Gemmiger sp.]MEE0800578.1 family 10 glycosylhydrolase [Gemmiger sp.]